MGLMRLLFGLGPELRETAEVFMANRTKASAQEHAEHLASLEQLGAEFAQPPGGWFDGLVNGMNRVPRPALALGTLGLFAFAMIDPVAFGIRMQGLALVPEPLWWLLGAVVSFYFGARELHYFRGVRTEVTPGAVERTVRNIEALRDVSVPDAGAAPPGQPQPDPAPPPAESGSAADDRPRAPADGLSDNPALAEWLALRD